MREKLSLIRLSLLLGILIVAGCTSVNNNDPKDVVIKLFGAMERNDAAAIAHMIDLRALMNISGEDYALQMEKPRVFHNPEEILKDMTDPGLTKTRWFAMQRVIGATEVIGDTAFVEVSFIDKTINLQYYNKFGLHKRDGLWRIYSFKTVVARK
jgi:hypothetical protein